MQSSCDQLLVSTLGLFTSLNNMVAVQPISSESLELGEGPHWDDSTQSLYYVDIIGKTIHKYTPVTNYTAKATIDGKVSIIIPIEGKPNQFLISRNRELCIITWDGISSEVSSIEKIAEVDTDPEVSGNRINDGKTDPTGRLWAGTMGPDKLSSTFQLNKSTLYSFDSNRKLQSHVHGVHISNGLAWSADLTQFFYIDSSEKRVDLFDYNAENGTIKNRRPFFTLEKHNIDGFPDGQTIDAEGNLWVAIFNGSKVIKIDSRKPETLLASYDMPAKEVTSVAFGGANLDELYVTTGRIKIDDVELSPVQNGIVYKITGLGVKGIAGVPVKL